MQPGGGGEHIGAGSRPLLQWLQSLTFGRAMCISPALRGLLPPATRWPLICANAMLLLLSAQPINPC
jgi:hypothetical protein